MKIEINEKTVNAFKEMGILTDHIGTAIMIAECMMNGSYPILDMLDDNNTNKNTLTVYKELEKAGVLERVDGKENNFAMSQDGIELMELLNAEKSKNTDKVDKWIDKYRELWIDPATKKYYMTPDKRSLGSSKRDLSTRMKKFLSEYRDVFTDLPEGLTPETVIIEATRNYIAEYKKVNFSFCKGAFFFISKQEGKGGKSDINSLLATNCENYIQSYGVLSQDRTARNKSIN